MRFFYPLCIFILVFSGCSEKAKNNSPLLENLQFGHRGSGANVYNDTFIENTLPSVTYALNHLDGCEVDIQMSLDGTIWLYHDDMLGYFCKNNAELEGCIPQMSDNEIAEIKQCRNNLEDRVYKLSEVFEVLSNSKYKNRYLSLDVKGYYDSLCFPYRNAPDEYFIKMAKNLIAQAKEHDIEDQLIVETGYMNFLDEIKMKNEKIHCHLIGYENFPEVVDQAIKKSYDGVSFSLYDESITVEEVKKAKSKNLEIQVWPIKDTLMLNKAIELKPFAMQLSEIKFSN
ncbi:MAG: glycerophosphodiester phosphodiesterase [Brumimicrobium sp.]